MAAPDFDNTAPDMANAFDEDLDSIRDNQEWLMIAAASAGYMLPGWTTTVSGVDPAEPTEILMTKGSREMKWGLVWSGGLVTQVTWRFNRGLGDGREILTGGTITPSYDGSDNFTGATPS